MKDDLLAGKELENGEGLTIGRLANLFLTNKQRLSDSGELEQWTWNDYHPICERVLRVFGAGRRVGRRCYPPRTPYFGPSSKTHDTHIPIPRSPR